MAKRKGWDALSPAQRVRYSRAGITSQSYNSGASLAKARGHGSEINENTIKKIRHDWREWNFPTDSLPAFVAHYGAAEARMISEQKLLAAERDPTAVQFMHAMWNSKPDGAPKSWYWYHHAR